MDTSKLNSSALFTQYVDVVNRALGQNKDRFPYKQLMGPAGDFMSDKRVAVAIYKDDPKNPHDWFTMNFSDGTFGIADHGKSDSDFTWKVKEAYLERVVQDPETYIETPSKLDFEWLKSRVGMD